MTFFPIGVRDIKKEDVVEATQVCAQMRRFGHAVQLDIQFDENKKFLSARCFHYITCKACVEIQRKRE